MVSLTLRLRNEAVMGARTTIAKLSDKWMGGKTEEAHPADDAPRQPRLPVGGQNLLKKVQTS
jgi:hypothetical protein